MVEENIDMLLKNSAEMRQLRVRPNRRNMVKFQVSIIYRKQFYATLRITSDTIEVNPFDDEIDPIHFNEEHMNGCKRILLDEAVKLGVPIRQNKGDLPFCLKLNFKSKARPNLIIMFRKNRDLERTEAAISTLFSASTDYEESEVPLDLPNQGEQIY